MLIEVDSNIIKKWWKQTYFARIIAGVLCDKWFGLCWSDLPSFQIFDNYLRLCWYALPSFCLQLGSVRDGVRRHRHPDPNSLRPSTPFRKSFPETNSEPTFP